jgi:hypothetical protein
MIPESALELDLPSIDQIGIVVENIEDGMERYTKLLDISPWTGFEFTAENLMDTTYRGRSVDHDFRLAIATVDGLDIELIEPLSEPTLYQDHLDEHGEGIHHVAYYARDEAQLQSYVDSFDSIDVPVVQSGVYEGTTYVYLDTRDELTGVMLEIVDRQNVTDRDPAFQYPSDE